MQPPHEPPDDLPSVRLLTWLSLCALLLAALIACWRNWRERMAGSGWRLLVVLGLVVAQVVSMVLTDSRNAWGVICTSATTVAQLTMAVNNLTAPAKR